MRIYFDICVIGMTFWRNPEMHSVESNSHYITVTVLTGPQTLQP